MNLNFTEEQEMLRDSARKFLTYKCPYDFVEKMYEDETGFTEEIWNQIAKLGWLGLRIPDEYDGLGLKFEDLALLFEETGRVAMPGPFFSTVVATEAILDAGSAEQKQTYLPRIATGELKATLALGEENFSDHPLDIQCGAVREENDFILNGTKLFVLDPHVADLLVVAARTSKEENHEKGISLFLVERNLPGISVEMLKTMDGGRKQGRVILDQVCIPAEKLLGPLDQAWPIISSIYSKASVLLAMESAGGGQKLLEIAVDYAQLRVCFAQPIGSYQAIKHKCATIMQEVEGARSINFYAAYTVDQGGKEADIACSAAKVYSSEMYRKASNETMQILGAVGFTWEHEMHVHMKRAKMNEFLYGGPSYHRERLAVLLDY